VECFQSSRGVSELHIDLTETLQDRPIPLFTPYCPRFPVCSGFLHLINIADAGSECGLGEVRESTMSTGPEPDLQLEMPELGAAFSIDNRIWDAVSINVEIELEVPVGMSNQ
jgi:hypothetical protein